MVRGMVRSRIVVRDTNGNIVAPRWLALAVPIFAAGASWGASYAATGARLTAVEARLRDTPALSEVQMIRDLLADLRSQFVSYSADGRDAMVKIARIEAVLEEMRRPR